MPSKQTRKPTRSSAVKRPGPANPATPTAISPVWERRLKELQAFKKKHGHCEVPHGYSPNPPLANWVARVRRLKQTGKIAPELARRLDELGFTWMLRRRAVFRHDWDAMVAALTAFKNQHGHCHVPWKPAKYRGLKMWLTDVRRRKRKGLLDCGRIRQLERLGVVWEPMQQQWEKMVAELVAYRTEHGDCNVPAYWPENPRLATWVGRQRHFRKLNALPQDRLERLDKIGFVWTGTGEAWESKYAALVEYQRIHGHCRVPPLFKDPPSLGHWVSRMRRFKRRGTLSEERIRRLDELGFAWEGALKETWAEAWESKYAALAEYQRTHGDCRVPIESKEYAGLGRWVGTMRGYRKQGKLSEERIRRLDELGFAWGRTRVGTNRAS